MSTERPHGGTTGGSDMTHEQIEELLAGYVLRSLSGPDAVQADRLLSDHVPSCDDCRRLLADFEGISGDLGLAATPMDPPDTLWPRIRRDLDPRARPRRRRSPLQLFTAAAAVVAIVGLGGLALSQGIEASDQRKKAAAMRGPIEMLTKHPGASISKVGQITEVSAPGVDWFYLCGTDVPEPQEGTTYRVWMVDTGNAVVHGGDFVPDDGIVAVMVRLDRSRYDALHISVEPAGSVPSQPSTILWRTSGDSG